MKEIAKTIRTPEQRKKIAIKVLIAIGTIAVVIGLFVGICALVGVIGYNANMEMVKSMSSVGCDYTPTIDEDTGYWTFVTDNEFRVLQLTDIHIGGGAFCIKKDKSALLSVETIIRNEKPDFIVVTGDVSYPVLFQAGCTNNLKEAELFCTMMEQLGIYWAFVPGNHDSEIYSKYDALDVAQFYSQERWEHCLFQQGLEDVDGYGNYIVNIKNSKGIITESLIMMDSHSYTGGDNYGIKHLYDNIHQNQIDWYETEVGKLQASNISTYNNLDAVDKYDFLTKIEKTEDEFLSSQVTTSLFIHIPLEEYAIAWEEYANAGYKDTENVDYLFGICKEKDEEICCGDGHDQLFEKILELGSTKNIFCGHDHLNTFTVVYKGVSLTYGMSIDFLAYYKIHQKDEQRGGTIITISPSGTNTVKMCPITAYSK